MTDIGNINSGALIFQPNWDQSGLENQIVIMYICLPVINARIFTLYNDNQRLNDYTCCRPVPLRRTVKPTDGHMSVVLIAMFYFTQIEQQRNNTINSC